jgi:hypothetical protein
MPQVRGGIKQVRIFAGRINHPRGGGKHFWAYKISNCQSSRTRHFKEKSLILDEIGRQPEAQTDHARYYNIVQKSQAPVMTGESSTILDKPTENRFGEKSKKIKHLRGSGKPDNFSVKTHFPFGSGPLKFRRAGGGIRYLEKIRK